MIKAAEMAIEVHEFPVHFKSFWYEWLRRHILFVMEAIY